jgi:hypothetical protein
VISICIMVMEQQRREWKVRRCAYDALEVCDLDRTVFGGELGDVVALAVDLSHAHMLT